MKHIKLFEQYTEDEASKLKNVGLLNEFRIVIQVDLSWAHDNSVEQTDTILKEAFSALGTVTQLYVAGECESMGQWDKPISEMEPTAEAEEQGFPEDFMGAADITLLTDKNLEELESEIPDVVSNIGNYEIEQL